MSKRHRTTRRRAYGKREHVVNEVARAPVDDVLRCWCTEPMGESSIPGHYGHARAGFFGHEASLTKPIHRTKRKEDHGTAHV